MDNGIVSIKRVDSHGLGFLDIYSTNLGVGLVDYLRNYFANGREGETFFIYFYHYFSIPTFSNGTKITIP